MRQRQGFAKLRWQTGLGLVRRVCAHCHGAGEKCGLQPCMDVGRAKSQVKGARRALGVQGRQKGLQSGGMRASKKNWALKNSRSWRVGAEREGKPGRGREDGMWEAGGGGKVLQSSPVEYQL